LILARYPGVALRGIDLAPGMVEHCRRRFADRAPRPAFEVADADHCARPPGALVVSNCTFQWLEDVPRALAAMRRKPGAAGGWPSGPCWPGRWPSWTPATARHRRRADARAGPLGRRPLAGGIGRAGLGLLEPPSEAASLAIEHASPLDVLRALRGIGAWLGGRDSRKRDGGGGADANANANAATPRRPLSARAMRRLERHYREYFPVAPTAPGDDNATSGGGETDRGGGVGRVVATYRAMFVIAEATER